MRSVGVMPLVTDLQVPVASGAGWAGGVVWGGNVGVTGGGPPGSGGGNGDGEGPRVGGDVEVVASGYPWPMMGWVVAVGRGAPVVTGPVVFVVGALVVRLLDGSVVV